MAMKCDASENIIILSKPSFMYFLNNYEKYKPRIRKTNIIANKLNNTHACMSNGSLAVPPLRLEEEGAAPPD